MAFWFNPQPGNSATAQSLTEAQWRQGLAKYFPDVDSVEAKQLANQDLNWVRTPDGDYWIGTGPGTFLPAASNASSASETTTSAQGDIPVTG